MEKFEQVKANRKQIFFNNFLGGIAWALGATVGLSIIVIILAIILKNVNLIPFFGNYVGKIIEFIISKNPNLFT